MFVKRGALYGCTWSHRRFQTLWGKMPASVHQLDQQHFYVYISEFHSQHTSANHCLGSTTLEATRVKLLKKQWKAEAIYCLCIERIIRRDKHEFWDRTLRPSSPPAPTWPVHLSCASEAASQPPLALAENNYKIIDETQVMMSNIICCLMWAAVLQGITIIMPPLKLNNEVVLGKVRMWQFARPRKMLTNLEGYDQYGIPSSFRNEDWPFRNSLPSSLHKLALVPWEPLLSSVEFVRQEDQFSNALRRSLFLTFTRWLLTGCEIQNASSSASTRRMLLEALSQETHLELRVIFTVNRCSCNLYPLDPSILCARSRNFYSSSHPLGFRTNEQQDFERPFSLEKGNFLNKSAIVEELVRGTMGRTSGRIIRDSHGGRTCSHFLFLNNSTQSGDWAALHRAPWGRARGSDSSLNKNQPSKTRRPQFNFSVGRRDTGRKGIAGAGMIIRPIVPTGHFFTDLVKGFHSYADFFTKKEKLQEREKNTDIPEPAFKIFRYLLLL
ncbi:unnamed protein product [Nesidiocoris tenuis]|uniref:Uncharacterized protein n=1 Tax=Nesidiocoris tenuis TaxID=355587 RepID=A0A6H5GAU6_9HEMI|nr:unnamed protein product [Nesidiocoris tenuis]